MITAFGPSNWCHEMTSCASGRNAARTKKPKVDGALNVYSGFFTQEHTLKATCKNYKEGRKIEVPVLLLYSEAEVGMPVCVSDVWREWSGKGVYIVCPGLGEGVGHLGRRRHPRSVRR